MATRAADTMKAELEDEDQKATLRGLIGARHADLGDPPKLREPVANTADEAASHMTVPEVLSHYNPTGFLCPYLVQMTGVELSDLDACDTCRAGKGSWAGCVVPQAGLLSVDRQSPGCQRCWRTCCANCAMRVSPRQLARHVKSTGEHQRPACSPLAAPVAACEGSGDPADGAESGDDGSRVGVAAGPEASCPAHELPIGGGVLPCFGRPAKDKDITVEALESRAMEVSRAIAGLSQEEEEEAIAAPRLHLAKYGNAMDDNLLRHKVKLRMKRHLQTIMTKEEKKPLG